MDKTNLTDHAPAAMKRPARPFTNAIVLHRFAADSNKDGVTTFQEAIDFFTKDPEGIATVAVGGSYKDKLPMIKRWRENGPPFITEKGQDVTKAGFVPYHFMIQEDGRVARMLGLDVRGAHASAWNAHSIGVCCLGNYEQGLPKKAVVEACAALCADILNVYGAHNIKIFTHDETLKMAGKEPKGCPGRHFPHELVRMAAFKAAQSGRA
jgi:hypothetical protein